MSKNILITGSTGFVGGNLISFIKNMLDYSIVEVKRGIEQNDSKNVSYDYLLSSNDIGYSSYVHLAGKAHDLKNTSDEAEYFKVNYELTKKLFERFLEDEIAKIFVFVSSVKAVAYRVQGEQLGEEHPSAPVTAYGKSKLKAEEYILDNLPKNKIVVILRPCMIHGPGNKGNLNLLYSIVDKGMPWPLGNFDNQRSFLSIDNLCYVIKEILEGKLRSGIYNVADDDPLSTSSLVGMISELTGSKPKIWNVSKALIKIIAKMGNYLPLPLNEERLWKLTENYLVSNRKLKNALGIEKMPVSTTEGMIKTLKSFR